MKAQGLQPSTYLAAGQFLNDCLTWGTPVFPHSTTPNRSEEVYSMMIDDLAAGRLH